MLTNFLEDSIPSETDTWSTSQEISRMLQSPKVHYRVYNSPSPVPILSQISPVHTVASLPYYRD
jgi:hypothetical protein